MKFEDPDTVLYNLLETRQISRDDLLTYGFLNVPIIRDADRMVVAYVVYWTNRWLTVCVGEGEQLSLAGAEKGNVPSSEQCLALFHKHCPELI
ncbi:MAG TPA: hypothetical protein PKH77_24435 [Anaerolineae bacterium]|nr:hypothetical protein [Anaerolineae bacterium]